LRDIYGPLLDAQPLIKKMAMVHLPNPFERSRARRMRKPNHTPVAYLAGGWSIDRGPQGQEEHPIVQTLTLR